MRHASRILSGRTCLCRVAGKGSYSDSVRRRLERWRGPCVRQGRFINCHVEPEPAECVGVTVHEILLADFPAQRPLPFPAPLVHSRDAHAAQPQPRAYSPCARHVVKVRHGIGSYAGHYPHKPEESAGSFVTVEIHSLYVKVGGSADKQPGEEGTRGHSHLHFRMLQCEKSRWQGMVIATSPSAEKRSTSGYVAAFFHGFSGSVWPVCTK